MDFAEHFNVPQASVKAFKTIILRDLDILRRKVEFEKSWPTFFDVRVVVKIDEKSGEKTFVNFRMTFENVEYFKTGSTKEPTIHLTRIPEKT